MNAFNEYISGRRNALSRREFGAIVDASEWFTLARRARTYVTGDPDTALALPVMFWPTLGPVFVSPEADDAEPNSKGQDSIIDRFIEHGGYRIVPAEGMAGAEEIDVEIDVAPEMVSEELAEIYLAQGLSDKANEIYRILKDR